MSCFIEIHFNASKLNNLWLAIFKYISVYKFINLEKMLFFQDAPPELLFALYLQKLLSMLIF